MGARLVDYLVLSRPLMKNINFDFKHASITATFKSSFVKFGKRKVLSHSKTYKWDNQGAVLSLLTELKRYSGEVREAKI